MISRLWALPALFLLAACSPESSADGSVPATPGERQALEDAAEMLDQRRAPPEAQPSPGQTRTQE